MPASPPNRLSRIRSSSLPGPSGRPRTPEATQDTSFSQPNSPTSYQQAEGNFDLQFLDDSSSSSENQQRRKDSNPLSSESRSSDDQSIAPKGQQIAKKNDPNSPNSKNVRRKNSSPVTAQPIPSSAQSNPSSSQSNSPSGHQNKNETDTNIQMSTENVKMDQGSLFSQQTSPHSQKIDTEENLSLPTSGLNVRRTEQRPPNNQKIKTKSTTSAHSVGDTSPASLESRQGLWDIQSGPTTTQTQQACAQLPEAGKTSENSPATALAGQADIESTSDPMLTESDRLDPAEAVASATTSNEAVGSRGVSRNLPRLRTAPPEIEENNRREARYRDTSASPDSGLEDDDLATFALYKMKTPAVSMALPPPSKPTQLKNPSGEAAIPSLTNACWRNMIQDIANIKVPLHAEESELNATQNCPGERATRRPSSGEAQISVGDPLKQEATSMAFGDVTEIEAKGAEAGPSEKASNAGLTAATDGGNPRTRRARNIQATVNGDHVMSNGAETDSSEDSSISSEDLVELPTEEEQQEELDQSREGPTN